MTESAISLAGVVQLPIFPELPSGPPPLPLFSIITHCFHNRTYHKLQSFMITFIECLLYARHGSNCFTTLTHVTLTTILFLSVFCHPSTARSQAQEWGTGLTWNNFWSGRAGIKSKRVVLGHQHLHFYSLIICPLLSSKVKEGTDPSILFHILFGWLDTWFVK